jgi:hypothetical protein
VRSAVLASTLGALLFAIVACGTTDPPDPVGPIADAGAEVILLADGAIFPNCVPACEAGFVCANGSCKKDCPSGQTACDALCIDLTSSNQNCGACGKVCDATDYCNTGQCVRSGCSNGFKDPGEAGIDCGGACATTNKCAGGSTCAGPNDCLSGQCVGNVCQGGGSIDGGPCTTPASCPTGTCVSGACMAMAASCKALKAGVPAAPDGVYRIDPDGSGAGAPFDVFCDMTTSGGGWTALPLRFADAAMWSLSQPTPAGATTCTTIGRSSNAGEFESYFSSNANGFGYTALKFVPPLSVGEVRLVAFNHSPGGACNSMDFDQTITPMNEAWYFSNADPSTRLGMVFASGAGYCVAPYVGGAGYCSRDGNLGGDFSTTNQAITLSATSPVVQMVLVQHCGSSLCNPATDGERFYVNIPADQDGMWRTGIFVR